jgi:ATP-dependent protease ClpP protease subunit
MLLINYILHYSALFNGLSRRNVINIGLSNIMMNKNLGNHYESNENENINYKGKYDLNFNYKIPELDSDTETKTVIHTEDNNLYFQGEITPESCFYLQQNLIKLQKKENENKFINFYIQSVGGSLLPTFGVIDTMKLSRIPINTFVNGYVASAGSLLSVSGHKRYITKNSMMLVHSLRTSIGEVNYQQLEDHYYNSASIMNIVKNIYKEKSNIDDQHLNFLLQHDYWLNSTECLKYQFVDYII